MPFELSIRYGSRTPNGSTYSYGGEKTRQYESPVLVSYNLFSLQADMVTYDVKHGTIAASGSVVMADELGATQRAESATFKIEDGQVSKLK